MTQTRSTTAETEGTISITAGWRIDRSGDLPSLILTIDPGSLTEVDGHTNWRLGRELRVGLTTGTDVALVYYPDDGSDDEYGHPRRFWGHVAGPGEHVVHFHNDDIACQCPLNGTYARIALNPLEGDYDPGYWYSDLHTADDIAEARQILTRWTQHTGNTEAERMSDRITARAIKLGLEEPRRDDVHQPALFAADTCGGPDAAHEHIN